MFYCHYYLRLYIQRFPNCDSPRSSLLDFLGIITHIYCIIKSLYYDFIYKLVTSEERWYTLSPLHQSGNFYFVLIGHVYLSGRIIKSRWHTIWSDMGGSRNEFENVCHLFLWVLLQSPSIGLQQVAIMPMPKQLAISN